MYVRSLFKVACEIGLRFIIAFGQLEFGATI